MKHSNTLRLLSAALALSFGVMGCQSPRAKGPTPIPGQSSGTRSGADPFGPNEPVRPLAGHGDITGQNFGQNLPPPGLPPTPDEAIHDRQAFSANTVYFDFDRATVKSEDIARIDAVAAHLRSNPSHSVLIEGHCDERGTEQYNMSLGDKRAQAVREYLFNAGIDGQRLFVITFGESHPADPGHNESAWAKNRRAEFVLLTPR